jgi:hypothetical protein
MNETTTERNDMTTELKLESVGTFWKDSGDLYYMTLDGLEARVFVDSLGETWVDVRKIPDGGYFHTERVEAWRTTSAAEAETWLTDRGFGNKRSARFAHHVRERAA